MFTKMLLINGLSPAQIFTLRFLIAYVLLYAFDLVFRWQSFRLFSQSWRDELMLLLLGVTGGSLYFLTENAAMLYTTATNTSLIVCSCPLFAMLLVALVYRHSERFTRVQVVGIIKYPPASRGCANRRSPQRHSTTLSMRRVLPQ